ncbi:MAG TPA: tetratricopeptide repeat protein [Burkholderiales bacterium]|jgi:tetratricopeptide (TPR) repeat protein|nr:tetratricopeptide repeat protein [Burkholderiales bacterium]
MPAAHFALGVLAAIALACGVASPAAAQRDGLQRVEQLMRQNDYQRALESVDHYLVSNPRDARGRFLKGVILTEQKKTQEAIKVYTELTQDNPGLPEPYNNLAVLRAALGEYEPARVALEMAVRVRPDYAVAHENLGDIYARMAAQSYEKAAKLDSGNKSAPLKLKQVTALLSGAPH